jgi:hypothetical protein
MCNQIPYYILTLIRTRWEEQEKTKKQKTSGSVGKTSVMILNDPPSGCMPESNVNNGLCGTNGPGRKFLNDQANTTSTNNQKHKHLFPHQPKGCRNHHIIPIE